VAASGRAQIANRVSAGVIDINDNINNSAIEEARALGAAQTSAVTGYAEGNARK
jgi:hypothetical protein